VEKFKMKKSLLVVALLSAFAPMMAQAEAGDIVVRLRAAYVNPDEKSRLAETVATNVADVMTAGANLAVGNNTIPELDISYYITKNIAAELILAVGTKHNVSVVGDNGTAIGSQDLGKVNLLPPTLTAQWHFNPDQTIDPYVGAGINYTHSLDNRLSFASGTAVIGQEIKIDQDMFGLVAQVGVDINLGSGWLLNADVKYIDVNTDVKKRTSSSAAWVKIDDLDINPWVFGVGIGRKF